jgi:hypothetical protein
MALIRPGRCTWGALAPEAAKGGGRPDSVGGAGSAVGDADQWLPAGSAVGDADSVFASAQDLAVPQADKS